MGKRESEGDMEERNGGREIRDKEREKGREREMERK